MARNLTKLSDDELDAESQAADAAMVPLRDRKAAVQKERDRRAFAKVLAGLNESQIDLLRQSIAPEGIESAEKLGIPGH